MSAIVIVVVVTMIVVGTVIVIGPAVVVVSGIVVAAVIIRFVIPRFTTKTETKGLRLRIALAYGQQS